MIKAHFFKTKELKPFLSLLIILLSLFISAFFKLTLRRLSYSIYQENKKFDKIQDSYYSNLKIYGKMTQPDRLENLAKKTFFRKKKKRPDYTSYRWQSLGDRLNLKKLLCLKLNNLILGFL